MKGPYHCDFMFNPCKKLSVYNNNNNNNNNNNKFKLI